MNKEQKGLTLISLIVMIVVLLILSVITYESVNINQEEAKGHTLESEIKMVQNAVLQRKTEADLTRTSYYDLPGENISKEEVQKIMSDNVLKGEDGEYKSLTPDTIQELGISNTEDTYIVNYRTGEVINQSEYGKYDVNLYLYATE